MFEQAYIKTTFPLNQKLKSLLEDKDYESIDQHFQELTQAEGELFRFLQAYCEFESIEFILSIRDAENEWEEDGIWHDDGSRLMAFSLSLRDSHDVEGGELKIRPKSSQKAETIEAFNFGEIIIFKTGVHGYEHKIHAVRKCKRVVIAGWCS